MAELELDALERGYEAMSRGDLDGVLASLDPELEWHPGEIAPEAGDHRGVEGFRRFLESWVESFASFRLEPELFVAKGEKAVAVLRQRGRGRGSGLEIDASVVHVWSFRDGRGTGWWAMRSREEALESLGDRRLTGVLDGYEAFNRGDIEGALALLHEEIVWHTYLVPGPGGGTYHGHQGVRELWSDARNVFGEFRNEPERLIAANGQIVAFIRVCGRGKESGIEVEAKIAHVHTFEGERVVRVESYEEREEALRAAGITV
jgi:uncharacterized protein